MDKLFKENGIKAEKSNEKLIHFFHIITPESTIRTNFFGAPFVDETILYKCIITFL